MFTSTAAIIASTVVAFPHVPIQQKQDFSIANVQIEESARDLGASEYQVFLHVTLPLAFPALLSGMILSLFVRLVSLVLRSCLPETFLVKHKLSQLPFTWRLMQVICSSPGH